MAASTIAGELTVSQVTVTTAGTAVVFPTPTLEVRSLTVVPWSTNTGRIYLGASDVASTTHLGMTATDTFTFSPGQNKNINVTNWYADSSVNGEGFDLYYNHL